MKVKDLGQVFTPQSIVNDVLDAAQYNGENILRKHVIDNSCGNGAFLIEIVKRYIKAYAEKHGSLVDIQKELKKYIHGIEIDKEIYEECICNLKNLLKQYKIKNISFDIINGDALKINKYDKKMDFVVGNPPYVRVHNLNEQYDEVKKYEFCNSGMTDLFIVFYEIGIKMLNKKGVLCYITPNSFYNSLAGSYLRKYIKENQTMELIMDIGHYQPFNVTTYTAICKIVNGSRFEKCKYYKYNIESGLPEFICDINYENLFIDNNIILSSDNKKYFNILNYNIKNNSKVQVKNGFATLNDKIFINNNFEFKKNVIDIIKASTGEWKKCIYPYDKTGKLIPFEKLSEDIKQYMNRNKKDLIKASGKLDSAWYGFGRSQAINDVNKNKISINTTIRDVNSIKLNAIKSGEGVYSGLYIITDISFDRIKEIICSEKFIEYLKVLNKCKSGGYYTFSSKDLAKYVNSCLEEEYE